MFESYPYLENFQDGKGSDLIHIDGVNCLYILRYNILYLKALRNICEIHDMNISQCC